MQIGQTRCDASARFSAAALSGRIPINSISEGDEPGCRPAAGISANLAEGGSFDPEAIDLMQAVLDEAWAFLLPGRQARTSRSVVARRILDMAADGERDRARLFAGAVDGLRVKASYRIGSGWSEARV